MGLVDKTKKILGFSDEEDNNKTDAAEKEAGDGAVEESKPSEEGSEGTRRIMDEQEKKVNDSDTDTDVNDDEARVREIDPAESEAESGDGEDGEDQGGEEAGDGEDGEDQGGEEAGDGESGEDQGGEEAADGEDGEDQGGEEAEPGDGPGSLTEKLSMEDLEDQNNNGPNNGMGR